jgi:hypothetical protein
MKGMKEAAEYRNICIRWHAMKGFFFLLFGVSRSPLFLSLSLLLTGLFFSISFFIFIHTKGTLNTTRTLSVYTHARIWEEGTIIRRNTKSLNV